MSLRHQVWQTLSGDPIAGRAPPSLRVMNDRPLTPGQMGMVAHHYKLLEYMKQVSVVPYLVQERTLADGTRIRMVSSYGVDTVMVWPAGGAAATFSSDALFVVRAVRTRHSNDDVYGVDAGSRGWYKGNPVTVAQLEGDEYLGVTPDRKLINGAVTLRVVQDGQKKRIAVVRHGGTVGLSMQGLWEGTIHHGTGVTLVGTHVFVGAVLCAEISGWDMAAQAILAVSMPFPGTLYVATSAGVLRCRLPTTPDGKPTRVTDEEFLKLKALGAPLPSVEIDSTYILDFKALFANSLGVSNAQFGENGRFVSLLVMHKDAVTGMTEYEYHASGTIAFDTVANKYVLNDQGGIGRTDEQTTNSSSSGASPAYDATIYRMGYRTPDANDPSTAYYAPISAVMAVDAMLLTEAFYVDYIGTEPWTFVPWVSLTGGTQEGIPEGNLAAPTTLQRTTINSMAGTYYNRQQTTVTRMKKAAVMRGSSVVSAQAQANSDSFTDKTTVIDGINDTATANDQSDSTRTTNALGVVLSETTATRRYGVATAGIDNGTTQKRVDVLLNNSGVALPTTSMYANAADAPAGTPPPVNNGYVQKNAGDMGYWNTTTTFISSTVTASGTVSRYLVNSEHLWHVYARLADISPITQTQSSTGTTAYVLHINADTGWAIVAYGTYSTSESIFGSASHRLEVIKLGQTNKVLFSTGVTTLTLSASGTLPQVYDGGIDAGLAAQHVTGQAYDPGDGAISVVSTRDCIMFSAPQVIYDPGLYDERGRLSWGIECRTVSLAVCDDGTVTDLHDIINFPVQTKPMFWYATEPTSAFEMTLLREKL